jgi:glutamyl-Q tRNA(Asp) synthetase
MVGRFAPSPTGPLHWGSLVTALGSYLEAKKSGGRWLVRMEDIDVHRCSQRAADGILRSLERLGFAWDGEILWQSHRSEIYRAAWAQLERAGQIYPCACSRRELADSVLPGKGRDTDGQLIYPGTCRRGLAAGKSARSWRFRVPEGLLRFEDAVQGEVVQDLKREVGDFVVWRADGLCAYQLAVVVDDAEQGVTQVVRGADLLGSTLRQVVLQRALRHTTPCYAHLPVVTNAHGEKLSKQTGAQAIEDWPAAMALTVALRFLGQAVPDRLSVGAIWEWAFQYWDLTGVARVPHAVLSERKELIQTASSCAPERAELKH